MESHLPAVIPRKIYEEELRSLSDDRLRGDIWLHLYFIYLVFLNPKGFSLSCSYSKRYNKFR